MDVENIKKHKGIYEKIENLHDELVGLEFKRKFISNNIDSKINVSLSASRFNFSINRDQQIDLPLDIIIDNPITKELVLQKLDSEIDRIKRLLEALDVEFTRILEVV